MINADDAKRERLSDDKLSRMTLLFAAHTGDLKVAITREQFRHNVIVVIDELRELRARRQGVENHINCPICGPITPGDR